MKNSCYFFSPLPLPNRCKNQQKIEKDYDSEEEEITRLSKLNQVVNIESCSHPDSLYDEMSSACTGCGAVVLSSLSLAVTGTSGVNHHVYSYNPMDNIRKKKQKESGNPTSSTSTSNLISINFIGTDEIGGKTAAGDDLNKTDKDEVKVLTLYEEIKNRGDTPDDLTVPAFSFIPVNEVTTFTHLPPSVRSTMYVNNNGFKRTLHLAAATREAFGKNDYELSGIILTGAYHYKNSPGCPSIRRALDAFKSETGIESDEEAIYEFNQKILNETGVIVAENSNYFFEQRRRTHVGLFLVAIAAHLRIVHAVDNGLGAIECCLDLAHVRAKERPSRSQRRAVSYAIAARSGLNQSCVSRLIQVAIDLAFNHKKK